ncbi:hypothetical protein CIHG_05882 [Coccidioides immitis H538.4]|uniref:Major facilitator superfamily (MFS) profile domain-containing protein n=1 Tax=Coccidioides immitis H538.4 TaxID=396776 RepID=A0A0J8RVL2_COCIT|nr:hypothetical protein CIHG_05882 [Coccidioides immitis H538.4]
MDLQPEKGGESPRPEEGEEMKPEGAKAIYDIERRGSDGKLNAIFENPLAQVSRHQLMADVERFCTRYNLMDHIDTFKKGALVSQNPDGALDLPELTEEDKVALRREKTHKWSQPMALFHLTIMCSIAAAVQGMDETVNNGAQRLYLERFNIKPFSDGGRFSQAMTDNLTGLIVGAPYLACAILGCWLTEPMNRYTARRGTIFITCMIAALASVWEGLANSWVNLFLARFFLGLGIGSKSSTVPIYAAECAPAPIRGALVMMWQIIRWSGA